MMGPSVVHQVAEFWSLDLIKVRSCDADRVYCERNSALLVGDGIVSSMSMYTIIDCFRVSKLNVSFRINSHESIRRNHIGRGIMNHDK